MNLYRYLAVIALAVSTLVGVSGAEARRQSVEALPPIAAAELPQEARIALARIRDNGPFPYERDGVAFGNREGMLPPKPRGYYHEYTVPTPGAKNRGARRIVCGGASTRPDACWYTGDHYGTFRRIRE